MTAIRVKTLKQIIEENNIIKYIDKYLPNLKEPSKDLQLYLQNLENLSNLDNEILEEYLSAMVAWQNYYHEIMVRTDVVRNVARQQSEYFYSLAVSTVEGSVNMRKDLAKSDVNYIRAEEIRMKADGLYEVYKMRYESCERAFKLISRILTKRLNLKYDI